MAYELVWKRFSNRLRAKHWQQQALQQAQQHECLCSRLRTFQCAFWHSLLQ